MGIVFALKQGQGIIGVPEQGTVAPTVLGHCRDKPLIQDVVQECVGDHRRDDGTLRATKLVIHDPTRRLGTNFEHPGNQAQKRLIGDPLCQHGEDLRVGHRIEKPSQVQIEQSTVPVASSAPG